MKNPDALMACPKQGNDRTRIARKAKAVLFMIRTIVLQRSWLQYFRLEPGRYFPLKIRCVFVECICLKGHPLFITFDNRSKKGDCPCVRLFLPCSVPSL